MARSFSLALASTAALVALAGHAEAKPIPGAVSAMIDAAADDPTRLGIVADVARKTNPDSVSEINDRVRFLQDDAEKRRVATLSSMAIYEGWKGQGEAGGSLATGNTDESGLTLGFNLNKETVTRRHRINALIDSKSASGVQTTERYFAGYQGDYKFDERFYANLLVSAEKDPFAGIESRFSESAGVGYRFLAEGAQTLDIDVGIAARQTRYSSTMNVITLDDGNTVGGRLGARYEWKITPDTVLTEIASAYVDSQSNTLESATALTTKLLGHLSWRASVNVRYESNPPPPRETTDTLTRFSLVYAF